MKRMTKEFFVVTNSFAAPMCSDQATEFVKAASPDEALKIAAKRYDHPCGLYAANCYTSANAYHKDEEPLAIWRSPEAALANRGAGRKS